MKEIRPLLCVRIISVCRIMTTAMLLALSGRPLNSTFVADGPDVRVIGSSTRPSRGPVAHPTFSMAASQRRSFQKRPRQRTAVRRHHGRTARATIIMVIMARQGRSSSSPSKVRSNPRASLSLCDHSLSHMNKCPNGAFNRVRPILLVEISRRHDCYKHTSYAEAFEAALCQSGHPR